MFDFMVHFITFQGIGSFRLVSGRVSPAFKSIVFWGFRDSAGDFAIFWEPQPSSPRITKVAARSIMVTMLVSENRGETPQNAW